jgi:hypothetical protein
MIAETPTCTVHRRHHPRVHETQRHHVWPVGLEGPEHPADPAGVVAVCPTGHVNIHRRLRRMLTAWLTGQPPPAPHRLDDPDESRLAAAGYAAVIARYTSLEGVDADEYRAHVARFLSEHQPGQPT